MARPLILCYHGVSSSWSSPLVVAEEVIAAHVDLLRRRGYVGLTFSEAERRRSNGTLPPRSVVVTFDDGLASTLRAKQILDEAGFPGTVFVVTAFVETGSTLAWPGIDHLQVGEGRTELQPLSWSDLERLVSSGWEVGSHTCTHPVLMQLGDDDLSKELEESRHAIERRLGGCRAISYPYGPADDRVARAAREAGYESGCTLTPSLRVDEPYRRPRVGLAPQDRGLRGRVKLSPAFIRLRRTRLIEVLEPLHLRGDRLPPSLRRDGGDSQR
jgi:peptidoglycan/xylan/chitin deacetylase (PgdA/CDA1 family)